jgi:hypothetical protein
MTDAAQALIADIQERYFNEGKTDPDSFESAFKNRFAQHTAKIALLDALSLGLSEIGIESVDWAHSLVVWQWDAIKELYELASAENDHAKDVMRVFQYIKKKGEASRRDITRAFQGIWWQKMDGILKQLTDGGTVICVTEGFTDGKSGPKAKLYRTAQ